MKKISKCFEYLIYSLPAVLFFSYYPLISLGGDVTMNYKLSLPMIWLVLFDLVSFILVFKKHKIKLLFTKYRLWLLFPVFVTISIIWSINVTRGVLTTGVMWLMLGAIFAIVTLVREVMPKDGWREVFTKIFYGSSLLVVGWCLVQCVLDVVGVGREYTLLCEGCTYKMFGFPHPNGLAIEPQFMGNLLLAPALVAAYEYLKNKKNLWLFFVFSIGLFLTFSRGAIYAYGIGMILFVCHQIIRTKKWKPLILFLVMGGAFLFTLNLQGVFAQVSRTDDTYFSGIAKVINHLSLGKIELRNTETPVEENNEGEKEIVESTEASVFDGYAEESTNIRTRLTSEAMGIWSKNLNTIIIGVGIGGAGQALFDSGSMSTPKEIVQNEYASLLLETGIIGLSLFILTVALVIVAAIRSQIFVIVALILSYAVTLFFFSGLPSALHIYVLPVALIIVLKKENKNASN